MMASGIQAIRSYQDSVYIDVTSQATERTSDVRSAMVSGSRRTSAPLGRPGTPTQGTTRESIQPITNSARYEITPTTTLAWVLVMNCANRVYKGAAQDPTET